MPDDAFTLPDFTAPHDNQRYVDACPPDLSALTPLGFKVESHDITLFGRCATCTSD